ncbi:hypothetical protein Ctob_014824 [Chrysochromulina tobinii]|uniref:Uncharacterized protein n=1 Tax=Chrysochromulina tobinii TaxID=1460289 RepID=A0A0M0K128_9EUKA|nr:hypothetical protein Ctob_014824 [Chrysochromulina tobinii]|eukprot:KOO32581.1 hypothetical protein Ctob_014824 [Chrysochromulina sp. CCMP291]
MAPDDVTCITKASTLPWLVSDIEPNVALPLNKPVTRAPPAPSCAMPLPSSSDAPPAWTAQSMAPDDVTCITKALANPRLVSDIEPNVALPMKKPVTRAPPAPSCAMPLPLS